MTSWNGVTVSEFQTAGACVCMLYWVRMGGAPFSGYSGNIFFASQSVTRIHVYSMEIETTEKWPWGE